jgi:hypothetical protein
LATSEDRLPATIQQAEVAADQRALNVVPALIADLGDEVAWRYVEIFTANIRNPNTRRAYARACNRFFAWCEDRGLRPAAIRPAAGSLLDRRGTRRPYLSCSLVERRA